MSKNTELYQDTSSRIREFHQVTASKNTELNQVTSCKKTELQVTLSKSTELHRVWRVLLRLPCSRTQSSIKLPLSRKQSFIMLPCQRTQSTIKLPCPRMQRSIRFEGQYWSYLVQEYRAPSGLKSNTENETWGALPLHLNLSALEEFPMCPCYLNSYSITMLT